MKFDLRPILASKKAYRKRLAGLPIEEKLAMLDVLRDNALMIRKAAALNRSVLLRERPPDTVLMPGNK